MGLSIRMFLLDQNDDLYRLQNAKVDRMLRDPVGYRIVRFAGGRVCMADVGVELVVRQPSRVVLSASCILTFDEEGCLDPNAFNRHQRVRAELALAPLTDESDGAPTVADAAMRFVAQGLPMGAPRAQARRIDDAALHRVKCVQQ